MTSQDLIALASDYQSRIGNAKDDWSPEVWDQKTAQLVGLCSQARPFALGEVLRLDRTLDMPISVIVACYRRLIELGVKDVRTMYCFANYLALHGPDWDDEANGILLEVGPLAEQCGLAGSQYHGHHPVFYDDGELAD